MLLLSLLPKLLIAGGSSFLGTLQIPPAEVIDNHTLAGEKIPSTRVVCRDRWGTPMLPDGKAGYSLIEPIKKSLIAQSLWIPPVYDHKPAKSLLAVEASPASAPAPATNASSTNAVSSGVPIAPAEAAAATSSSPAVAVPSATEPSAAAVPATPASATVVPAESAPGVPAASSGGDGSTVTPSPVPVPAP